MVVFFRLFEPEPGSAVMIDGVDIMGVPLALLRARLGVIPQDPVLFSGSIRDNLDPFNRHTDEEVWAVLRSIPSFGSFVHGLGSANNADSASAGDDDSGNSSSSSSIGSNALQHPVDEGGGNLSHGQRQLLCICRVLLRRSSVRVLLCDEATSTVDGVTDVAVQRVMQERFAPSTVLTIAHRLDTIRASSRVMVLGGGAVLEYAAPAALLADTGSEFYQMVHSSGGTHSDAGVDA